MKSLWLCCLLLCARQCQTNLVIISESARADVDIVGYRGVNVSGQVYYATSEEEMPHMLQTDENTAIQHFTNAEILLKLVKNKHIFSYLRAHLQTLTVTNAAAVKCPSCDYDKLQDHVRKIMQILGDISFDPSKDFQLTPILDSFFTDSTGNDVHGADYAFVQLVGPNGPYVNNHARFGVSYQGPGLTYLGHHHAAQELYVVIGGSSLWWTDTQPSYVSRNASFHLSNEHHAMVTPPAEPGLFFWSWTGDMALDIKHSPPDIQVQLSEKPEPV